MKPSELLRKAIKRGYTQTTGTLHRYDVPDDGHRPIHQYCALGAIGKVAGIGVSTLGKSGSLSGLGDREPLVGEIECLFCPMDEEKVAVAKEYYPKLNPDFVNTVEAAVMKLNDGGLVPFEGIATFLERIGC